MDGRIQKRSSGVRRTASIPLLVKRQKYKLTGKINVMSSC